MVSKKKNPTGSTRRNTRVDNKRVAHIAEHLVEHLNTLEDSFLRITAWAQQQEDRLKTIEDWMELQPKATSEVPEK